MTIQVPSSPMASDTVEPITIPSNMVRGRMSLSTDVSVPALAELNRTL
jgi:hypothetical protein